MGKYSGTVKVPNELAIAQVDSGMLANFGAKKRPQENRCVDITYERQFRFNTVTPGRRAR